MTKCEIFEKKRTDVLYYWEDICYNSHVGKALRKWRERKEAAVTSDAEYAILKYEQSRCG